MGRLALTAFRPGGGPRAPYRGAVEILLWLAPAAVVTLTTMLWVGWLGREHRGEVDREEAARRMGEALGRERPRPGYAIPRRPADHSSGVAIRPSRVRPVVVSGNDPEPPAGDGHRRAS